MLRIGLTGGIGTGKSAASKILKELGAFIFDADKEANFWVLRKVVMPAILSENFFMTNREESRLLLSEEGRDRIAKIHFQMIEEIESTKII